MWTEKLNDATQLRSNCHSFKIMAKAKIDMDIHHLKERQNIFKLKLMTRDYKENWQLKNLSHLTFVLIWN